MKMRKPALWFALGLLLIFFLALIPRVSRSTARVMLWYGRANAFWQALEDGDLGSTYQQYHPGVTTMWVSGLGTQLYRFASGLEDDELPLTNNTDPGEPAAIAGQVAMALVLSGSIVLIVFLLSRLTAQLVAFAAGVFLALDPFYITHSKLIHVDAFLATFMLVSAIGWFAFLSGRGRRYLILSAVFGGLAFLTKSPSYYLIPFVGLTAFLNAIAGDRGTSTLSRGGQTLASAITRVIVMAAAWLGIAIMVSFVLWPALWVDPIASLAKVFGAVLFWSGQPDDSVQFFAGKIIDGDPGVLFYGATLAWKTTVVSMTGAILAIFFIIRKRRSGEDTRLWRYLLLYAGVFLLMMSLSAKKGGRYLLPAIVAFDVLAGWAVVEVARLIESRMQSKALKGYSALLVVAILLIQAALVLRHYPHFGTHFNQLLGGTRVAQHILPLGSQGEGLDVAADMLNGLPDAQRLRVLMRYSGSLSFRTRFEGDIGTVDPDYLLVSVNFLQRGLYDESIAQKWESCQRERAAWEVSFDGVPYVWLCPLYSRDPDRVEMAESRRVALGQQIVMLGYGQSTAEVVPGEALQVQLYWQSDGQIAADNHVFVHLLNQAGELVAQSDGVPEQGERPTWSWLEDEIIEDSHSLGTPADLEAGIYTVSAGMYDFGTQSRLPAVDSSGERLPADSIELGDVVVTGGSAPAQVGDLAPPPGATPVESSLQEPPPTATPVPTTIVVPTATAVPTEKPSQPPLRFAVIGDYGQAGETEAEVAALVKSWAPDLIITTGDNNYPDGEASTIDANVGQYYAEFIHPYQGDYGPGADENQFFPTPGNHDWHQPDLGPYLEYFELPGNERYYEFVRGPTQFFALDSDSREPDGVNQGSVQAQWLKERLAASTAPWKIVYMHHAAYSSARHGPTEWMQWPFDEWGVSAVFAGHDHVYEHLIVDGLDYFTSGLGGYPARYIFLLPSTGSLVRFNNAHGAMLVEATDDRMVMQFITVDGQVIDQVELFK